MSNIVVGISDGVGAANARKKRRLLWRRQPRKLIRHLKRALEVISNMDIRESARAEEIGYNPNLFIKNDGSAEDRAIKRLLGRCIEALAETA